MVNNKLKLMPVEYAIRTTIRVETLIEANVKVIKYNLKFSRLELWVYFDNIFDFKER